MVLASRHDVVLGAMVSFLLKYGDLADKTNLWRCHFSVPAVRQMSEVFGVDRVSNEVMWDANGCKGSVLFE